MGRDPIGACRTNGPSQSCPPARTSQRRNPSFLRRVNRACHSDPDTPSIDLVIHTSGEQRLGNFLLFESAYAELIFIETLWSDFDGEDLRRAVEPFRRRKRR